MKLKKRLEAVQQGGEEVFWENSLGNVQAKILEVGDDYVELEIKDDERTHRRLIHFSGLTNLRLRAKQSPEK